MKRIQGLSDEEFAQLVRRAAALTDAPAPLVQRAIALFPASPSLSIADAAHAAVNRVLAVLAFDSWIPQPGALAVRSMPSDIRQLLFSAMGRDIDVRITPSGGSFSLTGQVLGPDRAGTVELTGAVMADGPPTQPRTARLDELGEFRLDGLAPGRYTLALHVADAEIELPPLEVGGARG